jgi:hypothetical protein
MADPLLTVVVTSLDSLSSLSIFQLYTPFFYFNGALVSEITSIPTAHSPYSG